MISPRQRKTFRVAASLALAALVIFASLSYKFEPKTSDPAKEQDKPEQLSEVVPAPSYPSVSSGQLTPNSKAPDNHPQAMDSGPEALTALGRRVLSERMRTDTEGLVEKHHPDGSSSLSLEGRFMHVSALVTDEEGHPVIQCFTEFASLEEAVFVEK